MRHLATWLFVAFTLGAVAAPVHAKPAMLAVAPTTPTGPGVIKGSIKWKGAAPTRAVLRRDSDPACTGEALDESIVVTKKRLAGVLVRIKNGTAGTWTAPTAPAVLSQRNCAYTPRVRGIQSGQPLAVDNDDATYHNVRGERAGRMAFYDSQPKGAARILKSSVGVAGDVLDLKCDVHPWMHAYVPVQDHPFFAVTGTDGSFELRGLAAGTYVLEAWHPVLGLKSQTITIGDGRKATAKASFTFKAPKAATP